MKAGARYIVVRAGHYNAFETEKKARDFAFNRVSESDEDYVVAKVTRALGTEVGIYDEEVK